jgi:hypothetical protein
LVRLTFLAHIACKRGVSWTEPNMAHLQSDGAKVFSLWHNEGMTGYRKRPRDPAELAKLMIDIASGEIEDREPLTTKDPRSG